MSASEATEPAVGSPARRRFSSLQHRDFRILWFGMVFSGSTFVFQWYAQSWFIVQTTDSPMALGILGGGRGVIMTLMSLYGGVLADRMDRRMLLILTQSVAFVIYAVLAFLVIVDLAPLWLVFLLIFSSGAALAVDQPVRQAFIPQLVPKQDIPNAMALVTAAQMGAFAYLPPLAGLAIDHLGTGWTFALSLFGHFGIIVAVLMVKHRDPAPETESRRRSLLSDAREGFVYAVQERTIFWAFAVTWAISGLGWPLIVALSPLWMKNELGMSATGFTIITSFWGTASLVAALYLAQRETMPQMGRLFLISAIGFCGSLVLFSLTRSRPLVALSWALNGLTFSINQVVMTALVQVIVPNEIRGRTMGLMTISRSVSQLSALPIALLAQIVGMTTAIPVMALACTGVTVVMMVAAPTLRRMAREG